MKIVRCDTPDTFLDATAAYRESEPLRTNVLASVAMNVLTDMRTYDECWWWVVSNDAGDVVGTALRTAPFGLQLAPMPLPAVAPLVSAISREDDKFPWVAGDKDIVTTFLRAYQEGAVQERQECFRPGVKSMLYELGELRFPDVEGESRVATSDDIDLVARWIREFQRFVGDMPAASMERDREYLLARLNVGSIRLWCVDDEPVAMAGHSNPIRTSNQLLTRIGPVFTPDVLRGRGFGSAVTAGLCAELVREGSRVMLYTDADNPASNRAYQKIGFRAMHESIQYDDDGQS